jgi:hypothetical protein
MAVTPDDFYNPAMIIDKRRETNNKVGSNVTIINVESFPSLSSLGISLARITTCPWV